MPRCYLVAAISTDPLLDGNPWPALGAATFLLHGAVKLGPDDLFGAGSPLRLWDVRATRALLSAIQAAMTAAGHPERFVGPLPSQVRAEAWSPRVFRQVIIRSGAVVVTTDDDVVAGDVVLASGLLPHRWHYDPDTED